MKKYLLVLLLACGVFGTTSATASLIGDDATGCFGPTGCTPAPFTIGAGPEFTETYFSTVFTVDFTGALGDEINFLFESSSSSSMGGSGSRTLSVSGLDWMPGFVISDLTLQAGNSIGILSFSFLGDSIEVITAPISYNGLASFNADFNISFEESSVSSVPAPATIWLFVSALISLVRLKKRRN